MGQNIATLRDIIFAFPLYVLVPTSISPQIGALFTICFSVINKFLVFFYFTIIFQCLKQKENIFVLLITSPELMRSAAFLTRKYLEKTNNDQKYTINITKKSQ